MLITFSDHLARVREHLTKSDLPSAWGALRSCMLEPFKIPDLQKLNRTITQHANEWKKFTQSRARRVAILGGYTTQPIRELLPALLLAEGYWTEIYEGSYNSFETEPFDPTSQLFAFEPDIVIIATGAVNIAAFPTHSSDEAAVRQQVENELSRYRTRWKAIAERSKAALIQHNFDLPAILPLGRLEGRCPWSKTNFIGQLNSELWKHDGREIRILDVAQLSSDWGRRHWLQPRWYHHSKHGFDPGIVAHYGFALAGVLRGILGKTRKCLVTDLDNTLWGGVIGDDGLEGIALGTISPEGEAFAAFGRYLKELQQLGVILAANSKNDPSIAKEVFSRHPESPLQLKDFAAFVCNWERKSVNLESIAKSLNLGLESLVFVDDNPAECEEIRATLPEVTVIEMAGDPSLFPRRIEELHLFTPLDLTAEDFSRQESYSAMQQMSSSSLSPESLEAYLTNLDMQAVIHPATSAELPRIEQLLGKTNQFNLTGRVFSAEALDQMTKDPKFLVLSAYLKDRIANHGLVSTLVARFDEDVMTIENWVMSCRVFTRTLEQAIFAVMRECAEKQRCRLIRAKFIPTSKNRVAHGLFDRLYFNSVNREDPGIFEFESTGGTTCRTHVQRVESFLGPVSA